MNSPVKKIMKAALVLIVIAGLLSACGKSKEKKEKNVTVGIVNLTAALDSLVDGYKIGMGEQGYTEGKNITYIYHGAVNNPDGLDAEVQKLVDAKVDLILSLSSPATLAAKRVTAGTKIPVIFLPVTDPVGAGIVDSLSHPGGNLTGVMSGQHGSKELEWLKTIVPGIKRVYIPYNPNDPAPSSTVALINEDAQKLGVEAVTVKTPDPDAVSAALKNMPADIDAILIVPDSVVAVQMQAIVTFALERKLPLATSSKAYAQMGGLIGVGGDQIEMSRQAARLSKAILNGTAPGNLPVEAADTYLTLNLSTASAIGITVPDNVMQAAKDIIR